MKLVCNDKRGWIRMDLYLIGVWMVCTSLGFSDDLPARDSIFSVPPNLERATDAPKINIPQTVKLQTDRITLESEDRVTLNGFTVQPALQPPPWPAVILVTMENKTTTSYIELVRELAARGWYVLSFDLRGTGGSRKQGIRQLDIQNFRAGDDYQRMVYDIEAAIRYLADRQDVIGSQLAIVGAELGANLSVQALRKWSNTKPSDENAKEKNVQFIGAVLLSPGQLYKGVACDVSDIVTLEKLPLFLCASTEDTYSYQTVRAYETGQTLNPNMEMYILEHAGTGTDMFAANRFLIPKIYDWLETQRKNATTEKSQIGN